MKINSGLKKYNLEVISEKNQKEAKYVNNFFSRKKLKIGSQITNSTMLKQKKGTKRNQSKKKPKIFLDTNPGNR